MYVSAFDFVTMAESTSKHDLHVLQIYWQLYAVLEASNDSFVLAALLTGLYYNCSSFTLAALY
jgi:hypothetical protein